MNEIQDKLDVVTREKDRLSDQAEWNSIKMQEQDLLIQKFSVGSVMNTNRKTKRSRDYKNESSLIHGFSHGLSETNQQNFTPRGVRGEGISEIIRK